MGTNDARPSGAIDQAAFEKAIRGNLSPEGIAAVIAFLSPATSYTPANDEGKEALRQVEWLADTLLEMLGGEVYSRLVEKLGL